MRTINTRRYIFLPERQTQLTGTWSVARRNQPERTTDHDHQDFNRVRRTRNRVLAEPKDRDPRYLPP